MHWKFQCRNKKQDKKILWLKLYGKIRNASLKLEPHVLIKKACSLINPTPQEQDRSRTCNFSLDSDEFKGYMVGEILLLISNEKSVSEDNDEEAGNYDRIYIRSLQARFESLERKLEQKQSIIENLLDLDEMSDRTQATDELLMGEEPLQLRNTNALNPKDTWDVEL